MTTLTLTSTIIAPLSDLSATVIVSQVSESSTESTSTMVRKYAGGRRRIISTAGADRSVSVAFTYMTKASYLALADLLGAAVWFRDQRNRAFAGVFADLQCSEWIVGDLLESVSFTIQEITYSEIA